MIITFKTVELLLARLCFCSISNVLLNTLRGGNNFQNVEHTLTLSSASGSRVIVNSLFKILNAFLCRIACPT